ncbi:dynamin family protein [Bacillus swezeyi]|uniref:dynamin family protein n=1 Tax=Bacillus swezeyi TaxID=1925020 RepID=UPI002E1EA83B|nr:dynamin family protein [Bacillus swezeyi]
MAHINTKDDLMKRAGAVFSELKKNGDEMRAAQLAGIVRKWTRKEVYIAFTGHYSAGKSSMLNTLLQEDVLPASPIPTSANLVMVRRGELKTALHTTDGRYAELHGAYDKQKVQAYCKDGSQIEMVEIEGPFSGIAPQAVLIDTPGIDSTDDAHFLSASSILHQADALFYVVHYNHVHSEENVNFLRLIKGKIPNVYFVVNQIDRHDETETDFQGYKKQVLDMLLKEGISEEHLFFTSVTEKDHPLNEFTRLRELLNRLQNQTKLQLFTYTEQKVTRLIDEHVEMLISDGDSSLSEEAASLAEKVQSLEEQLAESAEQQKRTGESFQKEVQTIIKNANLTPFDMRELAKSYLESSEKGFKKGLIFSKTKTLEEKEKRKEAFLADVQKRVQAEIDWHIIEACKTFMNRFEIKSDQLLQHILQFSTKIDETHLLRPLKKGAELTPEYVLNYTKELAENIRREAKGSAKQLLEQLKSLIAEKEERKFESAKAEYEKEKAALSGLEERLTEQRLSYEKANLIWDQWENGRDDGGQAEDWYAAEKIALQKPLETETADDSMNLHEQNRPEQTLRDAKSVSEYMALFENLARYLEGIPVLNKQREAFLAKTERLHSRQFTLALFGAFSSGKSSFANALCGRKVLPSSPTPTTATINKITKPQGTKQDGTADVTFKTETEITAELDQLLDGKMSEIKGKTLVEKLEKLLQKGMLHHDERIITENFLKAYERFGQYIADQDILTISAGELEPYVAEEETACAVREVTVYLHSPVTNKGITIVDTPGASSMNKRHTELAFQYMKDADALLYLTYYQHAFSKADRSFLRKLGLIKDAFSMDKMFFILNAADLAESAGELETVEAYVRGELLKEGIQNPHFYHVSSKQELSGKSSPFNDFSRLKKELDEFIENGLTKAAVDQLLYEGKKLCDTVIQLRRSLHRSVKEEEAEKKQIEKAFQAACSAIDEVNKGSSIFQLAEKDIEEQFYYMRQRLSYYAHDLFKAAIHPGLQNGNWQDNLQKALKSCLKEYEFEFLQELKALDIRIENMVVKYADEQWAGTIRQKLADNAYFSVHIAPEPPQTDSWDTAEAAADERAFADELKKFKTPKAFFQQNGKARLIESLASKLSDITAGWIRHEKQAFFSRCQKSTELLQKSVSQTAAEQIKEQKETYFHEPLESGDRDNIEKAYTAANKWLREIES